ncbi:hypothetical protein LRAMOSA11251 [Lichtheimia ramosa]|uniref:Uncharacterized protein n=1 Tax=Lichtheimia ramosa TaxID=688394 RepID=A0A077WTW0_9FUNG|nr:hypothetical protein LRAMOSA11251 [Lichtheimia ramosa]
MDASLRWETWVELTYGDDVNPWSKDVFVKKNFTSYAVMRALAGKGSGKISSTLQITTLLNEFKYILAQGKKEGLTIEAGLFSSFKSKCFGLIQAGLLSNEGRPKCVVGFKDTQRTEVVISPPCRLVQYHFQ